MFSSNDASRQQGFPVTPRSAGAIPLLSEDGVLNLCSQIDPHPSMLRRGMSMRGLQQAPLSPHGSTSNNPPPASLLHSVDGYGSTDSHDDSRGGGDGGRPPKQSTADDRRPSLARSYSMFGAEMHQSVIHPNGQPLHLRPGAVEGWFRQMEVDAKSRTPHSSSPLLPARLDGASASFFESSSARPSPRSPAFASNSHNSRISAGVGAAAAADAGATASASFFDERRPSSVGNATSSSGGTSGGFVVPSFQIRNSAPLHVRLQPSKIRAVADPALAAAVSVAARSKSFASDFHPKASGGGAAQTPDDAHRRESVPFDPLLSSRSDASWARASVVSQPIINNNSQQSDPRFNAPSTFNDTQLLPGQTMSTSSGNNNDDDGSGMRETSDTREFSERNEHPRFVGNFSEDSQQHQQSSQDKPDERDGDDELLVSDEYVDSMSFADRASVARFSNPFSTAHAPPRHQYHDAAKSLPSRSASNVGEVIAALRASAASSASASSSSTNVHHLIRNPLLFDRAAAANRSCDSSSTSKRVSPRQPPFAAVPPPPPLPMSARSAAPPAAQQQHGGGGVQSKPGQLGEELSDPQMDQSTMILGFLYHAPEDVIDEEEEDNEHSGSADSYETMSAATALSRTNSVHEPGSGRGRRTRRGKREAIFNSDNGAELYESVSASASHSASVEAPNGLPHVSGDGLLASVEIMPGDEHNFFAGAAGGGAAKEAHAGGRHVAYTSFSIDDGEHQNEDDLQGVRPPALQARFGGDVDFNVVRSLETSQNQRDANRRNSRANNNQQQQHTALVGETSLLSTAAPQTRTGALYETLLGVDELTNQLYTVVHITRLHPTTRGGAIKRIATDFARMMATRHNVLPRCYALNYNSARSEMHIIMEHLPFAPLLSITRRIPHEPEQIVLYVRQLVSGLRALHTIGVAHQNLKGTTVLVGVDGDIKLSGFFYSHVVVSASGSAEEEAALVETQQSWGTAADVLSLGMLITELLRQKPVSRGFCGSASFNVPAMLATVTPDSLHSYFDVLATDSRVSDSEFAELLGTVLRWDPELMELRNCQEVADRFEYMSSEHSKEHVDFLRHVSRDTSMAGGSISRGDAAVATASTKASGIPALDGGKLGEIVAVSAAATNASHRAARLPEAAVLLAASSVVFDAKLTTSATAAFKAEVSDSKLSESIKSVNSDSFRHEQQQQALFSQRSSLSNNSGSSGSKAPSGIGSSGWDSDARSGFSAIGKLEKTTSGTVAEPLSGEPTRQRSSPSATNSSAMQSPTSSVLPGHLGAPAAAQGRSTTFTIEGLDDVDGDIVFANTVQGEIPHMIASPNAPPRSGGANNANNSSSSSAGSNAARDNVFNSFAARQRDNANERSADARRSSATSSTSSSIVEAPQGRADNRRSTIAPPHAASFVGSAAETTHVVQLPHSRPSRDDLLGSDDDEEDEDEMGSDRSARGQRRHGLSRSADGNFSCPSGEATPRVSGGGARVSAAATEDGEFLPFRRAGYFNYDHSVEADTAAGLLRLQSGESAPTTAQQQMARTGSMTSAMSVNAGLVPSTSTLSMSDAARERSKQQQHQGSRVEKRQLGRDDSLSSEGSLASATHASNPPSGNGNQPIGLAGRQGSVTLSGSLNASTSNNNGLIPRHNALFRGGPRRKSYAFVDQGAKPVMSGRLRVGNLQLFPPNNRVVILNAVDVVTNKQFVAKRVDVDPRCADEQVRRLTLEMQIARMANHSDIVKCYGSFFKQSSNVFVLLLEYVPGMNLHQLRELSVLSEEQVRQIIKRVLRGLVHLHYYCLPDEEDPPQQQPQHQHAPPSASSPTLAGAAPAASGPAHNRALGCSSTEEDDDDPAAMSGTLIAPAEEGGGGGGAPTTKLLFVSGAGGGDADSSAILQQKQEKQKERAQRRRALEERLRRRKQVGIAHLDLKPVNIMAMPNGEIKIIDFGESRTFVNGDRCREIKELVPATTTHFTAPETFENIFGFKSDVWSIGALTLYLLTGKLPFSEAGTSRHVVGNYISGLRDKKNAGWEPQIPPGVSPECARFIRACLTPNPKKRPTSEELLERHEWMTAPLKRSVWTGAVLTAFTPREMAFNLRRASDAVSNVAVAGADGAPTLLGGESVESSIMMSSRSVAGRFNLMSSSSSAGASRSGASVSDGAGIDFRRMGAARSLDDVAADELNWIYGEAFGAAAASLGAGRRGSGGRDSATKLGASGGGGDDAGNPLSARHKRSPSAVQFPGLPAPPALPTGSNSSGSSPNAPRRGSASNSVSSTSGSLVPRVVGATSASSHSGSTDDNSGSLSPNPSQRRGSSAVDVNLLNVGGLALRPSPSSMSDSVVSGAPPSPSDLTVAGHESSTRGGGMTEEVATVSGQLGAPTGNAQNGGGGSGGNNSSGDGKQSGGRGGWCCGLF